MEKMGFDEGCLLVDGGLSIYFRVYGTETDKTPILCLPGFWRSSKDFDDLAVRLGRERRVITPDMRGRGRSSYSKDVGDYEFEKLLSDVWRLLKLLGVNRVIVVGVTLGGLMGLQMAARSPHKIAGLVLNDIAPERPAKPGGGRPLPQTTEELSFDAVVAHLRGEYGAVFPGVSDDFWVALAKRGFRQTESGNFIRDYDPLTNKATMSLVERKPTFWDEWRALGEVPALVVRAELSDFMDDEVCERMIQYKPDATIKMVHGCGHPPMMDEPEFLDGLDAFLKDLS